jgi:hypothetical protein
MAKKKAQVTSKTSKTPSEAKTALDEYKEFVAVKMQEKKEVSTTVVKIEPTKSIYLAITQENLSSKQLLERFSSVTLPAIVANNYERIGAIKRANNDECERAIGVILADLSVFFGGDLNRDQVKMLIDELTTGMNVNMTMEGIFMVCQQIKTIDIYGKKLNPNKVLSEIKKHLDAQSEMIFQKNQNLHRQQKFTDPDQGKTGASDKMAQDIARDWYQKNK